MEPSIEVELTTYLYDWYKYVSVITSNSRILGLPNFTISNALSIEYELFSKESQEL